MCRRCPGETKKQFYRRIALEKKQEWAQRHHTDDNFKSHFVSEEEATLPDDNKTKMIQKNEPKSEQRIKNRQAAQESRQRHRQYVQELERKVKTYEEMLQQQGFACRSCRRDMREEINNWAPPSCETMERRGEVKEEEERVGDYFSQHLVRVDNSDAVSPFAIFFVVCVVAALAVLTISPHSSGRFLFNSSSSSTLGNNPLSQSDTSSSSEQTLPKFLNMASAAPRWKRQACTQTGPAAVSNLRHERGWTRLGQYMCSESDEGAHTDSARMAPDFYVLRRQRQEETVILRGREEGWSEMRVSECYLNGGGE